MLLSEMCAGHLFVDPILSSASSIKTTMLSHLANLPTEEQRQFAKDHESFLGAAVLVMGLSRRAQALEAINNKAQTSEGGEILARIAEKCFFLESLEEERGLRGTFGELVCALEEWREERGWDYEGVFEYRSVEEFLGLSVRKLPPATT